MDAHEFCDTFGMKIREQYSQNFENHVRNLIEAALTYFKP